MHHEDEGTKFVWFLAGVALGAAVALLWAPAPGRETREQLRQRAGEGRDRLAERGREAMERGREGTQNIRRRPDAAEAGATLDDSPAEEQAEGTAG